MAHEQRHTRFLEARYGWKNVVAGAIGGLVASFAMERFMALTRNLTGDQPRQLVEQGRNAGQIRRQQKRGQPEGPPVNAAILISERVFQHELTPRQRRIAGPAMHYALGALMGAGYGALAEVKPVTTKALGAPFGAAVWLGADEIAMPAAGLSQRPTREPFVSHVRALGAHLVYGVATELSRRALLRVMVRSDVRKTASSLSHGPRETRSYAAS